MLSVPKFVVLILVAVAVWYAMRWLNRTPANVARRRPSPSRAPQAAIEDLVACRVCGSYVATDARACGKPGCPQPR